MVSISASGTPRAQKFPEHIEIGNRDIEEEDCRTEICGAAQTKLGMERSVCVPFRSLRKRSQDSDRGALRRDCTPDSTLRARAGATADMEEGLGAGDCAGIVREAGPKGCKISQLGYSELPLDLGPFCSASLEITTLKGLKIHASLVQFRPGAPFICWESEGRKSKLAGRTMIA